MKGVLTMLSAAWLAVLGGGTAVAQDPKPTQDTKPAAITVLEDTSPVMYGRSAKIRARVEAVDLDAREITLKGPKGRLITLRVQERVRNLPQAQGGDEVIVRYLESGGLQLRKAQPDDPIPSSGTVPPPDP